MIGDSRRDQRGVTLVETLVALAVMGFVIAGLLALVGQNTRFAASMHDRTFALIAADNLMVEALSLNKAREPGEFDGEVEVGGRMWRYRWSVAETGVANNLRIDVAVMSADTGQVVAQASSIRRVE